MRTQREIYSDLLKTYQKTNKIGPAKPYNMEHAKKIAWAAASNIYNKQFKTNTTALFAPKGQSPWSPVGCRQLELFSTQQYK
jgi:hypothetical protein